MNEITVKFKKLDQNAIVPSYAHKGDVGMDMTAISIEYDADKDMYIYHTGLSFESDFNVGQFLFVRSSNCKTEAYLCNHVGIADSAIYRGEIQFRFKNIDSIHTIAEREASSAYFMSLETSMKLDPTLDVNKRIEIALEVYNMAKNDIYNRAKNLEFAPYDVGDRIGQMVFIEYPTVKLIEVEELSDTIRGECGFGSTGK